MDTVQYEATQDRLARFLVTNGIDPGTVLRHSPIGVVGEVIHYEEVVWDAEGKPVVDDHATKTRPRTAPLRVPLEDVA